MDIWIMATIKTDSSVRYQTVRNGEIEEKRFHVGEDVHLVQTWEHHYLVKDRDGHYYNLRKELVQP